MNPRDALWLAQQRRHWMLPDPSRWLEPDQRKRTRPEPVWRAPMQAATQVQEEKYQAPVLHAENRARLSRSLAALRRELASVQADLLSRKRGFNPGQLRVPKGNPDGGEWTSDGGASGTTSGNQSERVRLAANKRTPATGPVTDADGRLYYRRGGHHEMPESVYKKWNLQPETARVFKESSTGPLPTTYRETPEGPRIGNIWGALHDAYNDGVTEVSQDFFSRNGIRPDGSNMTPDHARELLERIRQSEDPRIRDFNYNMRRIQRLFRLRGGSND